MQNENIDSGSAPRGAEITSPKVARSAESDPVRILPLDSVQPSPENDQIYRPPSCDDQDIKALAKSIRQHGLREPIAISRDRFILSGHRRWVAAKLAGLTEIPCRMVDVRHGDPEFLPLLVEYNRQRVKGRDEQLRETAISVDPAESSAMTGLKTSPASVPTHALPCDGLFLIRRTIHAPRLCFPCSLPGGMDWFTRNFRVERRSNRFNSRMVKVRESLGFSGFRLSTAGQEGKGYRILGKIETVDFAAHRDRRRAEQTLADARMLDAIDGSDLSPSDQVKLKHSQERAVWVYLNMISLINQQSLPPFGVVAPPPSLKAPKALKQAQEISQRDTTCLHVTQPDKP